ncbi:MAG: SHOCT domain-containing protein [Thermoplasmata archaeon]
MRNNLMKIFWVFIGIIVFMVVLSVALSAVFVPRYASGYYYPGYGMMGYGWGIGWVWMSLMMIVPAILLIFFIVWIVEVATGHEWHSHADVKEKTAMDILDERLASGSITSEEYEKIKEALVRK